MRAEKVAATLRVILEQTKARGFPPTHVELAELLGLAGHAGSRKRVASLVLAGLVTFDPRAPRSIRVTEAGHALLRG